MSDTERTAIVIAEPEEDDVNPQALIVRDPQAVIESGTKIANALASVIEGKKLYNMISGKKFVRCEGWTTMGAMLGITPAEESVQTGLDGSYVATVKLIRNRDGMTVGKASAECGAGEPMWMSRASYARRSMALTRATSKALRLAYSWIMVLSGFEATPAEEMPEKDGHAEAAKPEPQPATTASLGQFAPPTSDGDFMRVGYVSDVTPKTSKKGKPFTFFRLCQTPADAAQKNGFSVSCFDAGMAGALKSLDGTDHQVEAHMKAKTVGKQVYYNLEDLRVLEAPKKEEITDKDIPF